MRRKFLLTLLLLLLSFALIYAIAVYIGFDFTQFVHTVSQIPPSMFIFWLILSIVEYALQSERFRLITSAPIRPLNFAAYYNIGHLAAFLSPTRSIGEAARVLVFKKYLNITHTQALSSIVMERAFDILILSFASLGILILLPGSLAPFAFVAFSFFFIIVLTNHRMHSLILRLIPISKLRSFAENYFLHSTKIMKHPKNSLKILIFSILLWLFDFIRYWSILSFFGIQISFNLSASITSLSYFSTIFSIFPGGLAFFEGAGTGLLSLLGYNASIVLGAILVERIFSYWMWIFTGVFALFHKGLNDIREVSNFLT